MADQDDKKPEVKVDDLTPEKDAKGGGRGQQNLQGGSSLDKGGSSLDKGGSSLDRGGSSLEGSSNLD
ncbi:hypothetical protein BH20VER2_BH20VER2_03410 [soil metagenome]|nr:hypothetical protein [Chthoniobacterales bacterium]